MDKRENQTSSEPELDFAAIFAEGEARNAARPHGLAGYERQQPLGTVFDPERRASVTCNCGRRFEARTDGIADAAYRRHAFAAEARETTR